MSENSNTVGKAVQQVLRKCARDDLRTKGIVEFLLSDSETSEPEPQGKGEARTMKRKHSSNEEPRTNNTSNRGGSSGSTGKKHLPKKKRGEQQVLPPPNKKPRGGSNRGARGHSRPNPYHRQGNMSPPRMFRCRHCSRSCDRYDRYCAGCGRQ